MYDDWFVRQGDRVRGANFPLTAALCTHHRLDYADHKTKYKCTQLGCWGKGVPTPTGDGLEFALHAEVRLGVVPTNGGKPMVADSQRSHIRHPATKSVKIQNAYSDSQRAKYSRIASDRGVSSRRM